MSKPLALAVREKLSEKLASKGLDPIDGLHESLAQLKEIADDLNLDPDTRMKAIQQMRDTHKTFLEKTVPNPKSVDMDTGKSEGIVIQHLNLTSQGVTTINPEDAAKEAVVIEDNIDE